MAYKNNKGFTLIELLVGISISTILMISVGFLIIGGIKNITSQEKILQNSADFSNFQNELINIFDNIDTSFEPKQTASGVIVKIKQNYDQGGFAYIGEYKSEIPSSGNNIYCNSGSEDYKTIHIFIKTFIPDFNINIQKSHKINGIGRNIFGYNQIPESGLDLDKVYLNNPTGTGSSSYIEFVSDTLNNRILYKSGGKVYELLDREDGLSEPTDLKIISGDLYIANSGKGEILKLSSKKYTTTPELTLTGITANNVNKFQIEFFDQNGNKNITNKGIIKIQDHIIVSGDNYSKFGNKVIFSYSGGTSQNFNNNYIKISKLTDFTQTGSYYVKLNINNKYYTFFVQGDDNLLIKDDNTLESLVKNGKYYTKIKGIGNYSEFIDYNNYTNYNKKYDYILKNPIKKLNITYNSIKKLLNLKLDYYNKYNCYNIEEKSSREFILKKNFKY